MILWATLIILVYFASRLTNLTALPIFTDEAIYIRWSQIGARDANWRFISLTDGKQPMFTWFMMALLRVVPGDPLYVGRLVSVFAGAGSMVGLWFLAYELFKSRKVAFFSSGLYLISPFGLMYDRMALYDSLVATFYIWNFYLAILLVRRIRLDVALILGMILGAGMLNKTSGFLSLYLLPMTLLLFDWHRKDRFRRFLTWFLLAILAALLSQVLYSILRLSPFFHMVAQKDQVFIYSFGEWMQHPVQFLEGNLKGLFDWLIHYLSVPVFIATMIPLLLWRERRREKLLLALWWLIPFLGLASFGRVLYPRFIFFMVMPLLVLAATTVFWLWVNYQKSFLGIVLFGLVFFPSIITDYFIITDPLHAPIPYADKGQYIDNWPAGWGIPEVNQFVIDASKKGNVTVYTEGTFGLLPYAVEMYVVDYPNVEVRGIWPLPKDMPKEILESARLQPTFLVLNQSQELPGTWPVTLVFEKQKGNRKDRKLRFYQVETPPASSV